MYIKRNSIFLIDREPDKPDGKLRYRIKWEGQTVAFNVGFRVEFKKWSRETQRCKNNTTHGKKKISAAVINREINRFEQLADEYSILSKLRRVSRWQMNSGLRSTA